MVTADSTVEVAAPVDQAGVAEIVRTAYESRRAVFPVGGGTWLLDVRSSDGLQLDLSQLNRVVDYTPRDMTIVVEAGVRMAELAATLAAEGQQLPIDVPRAGEATVGGVVATNWTGPRRLGHGTMRDYVIGIHAVDGRGVAFKGGGRVVKNVAGYDFCKLLTGSLGTIGVITQLALKVKPLAERAATVVARCGDLDVVERILGRLVDLPACPTAIDLLIGSAWRQEALPGDEAAAMLVVHLEGSEADVAWLAERVQYEFWQVGAAGAALLSDADRERLWLQQVEFVDRGAAATSDDSPLVLKIAVPPSAVPTTIAEVTAHDADCTIQAHAASGIVVARFSRFSSGDVSSVLMGGLRPAAIRRGGSVVVLDGKLDGLTPHIVWGGRNEATILMERIKQEFDPRYILSPGRYIF